MMGPTRWRGAAIRFGMVAGLSLGLALLVALALWLLHRTGSPWLAPIAKVSGRMGWARMTEGGALVLTPIGWLGLIGGVIILSGLASTRGDRETPAEASEYGSHGTAKWATAAEIQQRFPGEGAGAVLGRLPHGRNWRPVIFPWATRNRNRFILIVGPPGSGKSSRYSLPNLVHAALHDPDRSLLITDPKGELYRNMAGQLRQQGFEIRTINLLNPRASDRYNPLDYVHTVEDAFRLSNTIISNTSGSTSHGDPFWINAEKALLTCLIWYVRKALEPQYQHLGAVLHLGNTFAKDPELMESVFSNPSLDETAKTLYAQIASLSEKTRDGVFIGFAVRLQLWASKEICTLTAGSDFHLRDLGRRRIALFLIIPDHHSTYQALTSLFFDQTFQELIAEADEHGGRLPFEVRLMLEEMANIGRITDLEKRLSTIRSRGLLVEMILQTIGQLKALYGDAWNTITGCADTVLVLAANDQETAEWVSKRLGTTTIKTSSTSNTNTDRGGSDSRSYHFTSRALMLPDEVQGQGGQGLRDDEILLIQRGIPPARLIKFPIDEFPGAEGRTETDPASHPVSSTHRQALVPDRDSLTPLSRITKQGGLPNWLAEK